MKATIYARISRDREGARLGVGTQEADCRELAAEMGASVVAVHTDNDLSAYSGKPRPGYRAVVGLIDAGEVDAVLVWHTDRLHRSPLELEDYITRCEPRGVRTYTVKAGPLDLSTASGLLAARMHGNIARYEIDHARERMHRAKLRSAQAGRWKGGRRPFGYDDDGISLRDTEAEAVRTGADLLLAGDSLRAVARAWTAAGLTTATGAKWTPEAVKRVMVRPRNAGLMEHRGEVVGDAEWPAIIDAEKWHALERLLTDPTRRTNGGQNAPKYLGSGLYLCGVCGTPVRVSGTRTERRDYRCRIGSHVTRNQAEVDAFIRAVVAERLRQPDAADLLRPTTPEVDVKGLETSAVTLRHRLDQLADIFAEGGIDAQQLATGTKRLQGDLDDVRGRISAAYAGTAFSDLGTATDAAQAWRDAPLERQRIILEALLTATLLPARRGRPPGWKPGESYFRPETVQIEWRGANS